MGGCFFKEHDIQLSVKFCKRLLYNSETNKSTVILWGFNFFNFYKCSFLFIFLHMIQIFISIAFNELTNSSALCIFSPLLLPFFFGPYYKSQAINKGLIFSSQISITNDSLYIVYEEAYHSTICAGLLSTVVTTLAPSTGGRDQSVWTIFSAWNWTASRVAFSFTTHSRWATLSPEKVRLDTILDMWSMKVRPEQRKDFTEGIKYRIAQNWNIFSKRQAGSPWRNV